MADDSEPNATVDPKSIESISPRFTVVLGSSTWSTATYGIVEFLRRHRVARAGTATVAVVLAIIIIASFIGLKIPGIPASFMSLYLLLLLPWLFWAATVSGSDFKLEFPAAQASKERKDAEEQFQATSTPEDALALDLKRLNEYYLINQSQARSSFRWAIFAMFLGLGTIVAGIWLFYFRSDRPDTLLAGLSTATGLVINIIGGLFLYLHAGIQARSQYYFRQLAASQKLALAMRLVEAHQEPAQQRTARDLVIRELLEISRALAGAQSDALLPEVDATGPKRVEV